MGQYIARRALISIPVLLIASIAVFVIVKSTADPVAAIRSNPRASQESIKKYAHDLGLDKPPAQQYLTWLGNFVRGKWGTSIVTGRPVAPDIREGLANTLLLGLVSFVVSIVLGVAVGMFSAIRQYSIFDYLATGSAFLGLSIPVFWFALILQIVFGLYLTNWFHLGSPIFPTAGLYSPGTSGFSVIDRARHLVLPVTVLSVQIVALYSRYTRAGMLEVLHSDYLRTARAKGLSERTVMVRHAMRNALIPLVSVAAIDVGALAGGLIVTETIFAWPGMGVLFISAMRNGDFSVVLTWMMIVVAFVIAFNLVADILYAVLDPRIRYD
jgi:peptide/nickel transport system permease protein